MKNQLLLATCILFSLFLTAQKGKSKDSDIPSFGNVDKADLQLKECDFVIMPDTKANP